MTNIEKYNYYLPAELIASAPVNPRDTSRLLVFDNLSIKISDELFFNLGNFLKPGDLIIINNSKVMPARLFGKKETGGKVEVLLLEKVGKYWDVLIGGKVAVSDKIIFDDNLVAMVIGKDGKNGLLKFNLSGVDFWQEINRIGKTPIPPYIKNSKLSEPALKKEYQTVYAKNYGSAAAPTAGLHFTKKLIGDLESAGIEFASIDLHVGLGTFAPINDEDVKKKKLHSENFSIPCSTIEKILATKKSGGRIFAVGTTTVRTLESSAGKILSNKKNISGSTNIFIQPGDKFQIVDGLITNFHLPKSSLMMLVAAFIQSKTNASGCEKSSSEFFNDTTIIDGREKLLQLYQIAIDKKYRFYSFGDAMLII
ncbi:MAG: tRNA preQ1(34) S-adenosylmethionine ribosyltransferase-isomerase QueA [Candidatus Berkelbacteria bacterium]|nr:tRNA preQ1(34) S-adenosylmethionine ribosyltransferase-isomerase QueA [Candidatus Berkelbacteria bacterium]